MSTVILLQALGLLLASLGGYALDNGLSLTPAMGQALVALLHFFFDDISVVLTLSMN